MTSEIACVRTGRAAVLSLSAQALALCMLTAGGAAAQSSHAQPHCRAVGGSLMTNFIAAERTLGTAEGDLRGAVSATLLGVSQGPNGTTVFSVQHYWVTETGDRIDMEVATATATEIVPGMFAIISYPVKITGGTGRFEGATGQLQNIGSIDLTTQRTVFRYVGEVCFRSPSR
jgi:hypothetical protein